jgi:hypothetical protein
MHKIGKDPSSEKKIAAPFQTSRTEVKLEAFNDTEPGFLRLKVTKKTIRGKYYAIDFNDTPLGVRDNFTITL